jgi:hypothetical protein
MFPGLTEGRIVHYVMQADPMKHTVLEGQHRPAVVVNSFPQLEREDGYANLLVFLDGENDGVPGGVLWVTSKVHSDNQEPGTWHWPKSTFPVVFSGESFSDEPNQAEGDASISLGNASNLGEATQSGE